MTLEEREELYDEFAQKDVDDMEIGDLLDFFYSHQYDYYASLSDEELKAEVAQKELME